MQIIVTGHGNFASGIESTVKLLAGSIKNVHYLDFTSKMGEKDLASLFKKTADQDQHTLFFCDLLGGTPFKQAVEYKAKNPKRDVEVICGCNVGSLLEIALPGFANYRTTDDLAKAIMNSAKAGIQEFGDQPLPTKPADDEDGI